LTIASGKQSVKNSKLVLEAQTVSSDCPVIPAPSKFETSYELSASELKFMKEKDSANCKNKDDSSTTQFFRL
jgi:nitrate/TMAO reductase-like tetraheme cytochrome c subunit